MMDGGRSRDKGKRASEHEQHLPMGVTSEISTTLARLEFPLQN
jgi:hypothetical protein